MKLLKSMFLFLSLSLLNQSYAEDFSKINQYVDQLSSEVKLDISKPSRLIQIHDAINEQKKLIDSCITENQKKINQYETEINDLKNINQLDYAVEEKNNRMQLLQHHQDTQNFCRYINSKIEFTNKQIVRLNGQTFQIALIARNKPLNEVIESLSQSIIFTLPPGFIKKHFIEKTSLLQSFRTEVLGFLIFLILKFIGRYKWKKVQLLQNLSIKRFLFVIAIYALFAPMQYVTLRIIFFEYGDEILQIFRLTLLFMASLMFMFYSYRYFSSNSMTKDVIFLALYGTLWVMVIHYFNEITYLKLYNGSEIDILAKKYIILILLQPMIYINLKFIYVKILRINYINHKHFYFVMFFLCGLIFMIGILYFMNLAINLDLLCLINSAFVAWILILNKVKQTVVEILNNSENPVHQKLSIIFLDRMNLALIHIKVCLLILYAGTLFLLSVLIVGINFWISFARYIQFLVNIFLTKHSYNALSISTVNIVQAVVLILLLNLINYALSNFFAKQLFKEHSARYNACLIFNWIGYVFEFVIILKFLGFDLQNIFILLGGISFGLGLGLKNIISGFISSLILYVNRPFKHGDFIQIPNMRGYVRGYVKKISLMETTIETTDSDIVILPNQYITQSIIENFTYENKSFQNVHIKYVINAFNVALEDEIKNVVIKILRQNENIVESPQHPIKQLFSLHPQIIDAYYFEIIFSLNNRIDINHELTKINREIYDKLKSMQLDIHFEDIQYPFK